jgi:predicted outer membrane protein
MKLTIFTTLLAASFALAQDPAATTTTPPAATTAPGAKPKPLAAQDKSFVKNTTESMYFLINIAEKTKRQAVSEDVKKLGAKITENLNKAWGEIGTVASAAGETMPTELKGGDKAYAARLGKAEADKFDKMFAEQAGKEAKKLARYLETGSKSAQNAELKALGEKYAAMVKGYESEAETVEKALNKPK